ncbi:MAG: hypothetical protein LLF87_12075 [Eubacteriales bacterium]|nr:hypothetical protein [Eubacteriales bacterium]
MKRAVLVLLCVVFLSACAAPQSVPAPSTTEAPITASPAASPPEDVYVSMGGEYVASLDVLPPEDLPRVDRPFPGKWGDEELRAKLGALPPIHLETPQTGDEKLYFKEREVNEDYLTEGTLTKEGLNALVKALGSASPGQMLKATLEGYGLTFQVMRNAWREDFPLFAEWASFPCRATLRKMEKGVYLVTVGPANPSREDVCHLVFCKENGAYRFAAMCTSGLESAEYRDSVVSVNGLSYFVCNCGIGWGTGTYVRYLTVCPLQAGGYGRLWYQSDGYDCPWGLCENLAIGAPEAEPAENGGAHLIIEGTFSYENYSELRFEGFENIFCGTFTAHVYDDGDGEGLYMYAGDIGLNFGLYNAEGLKAPFAERAALMLEAQNDEACLLAENFVWERNLSPQGYPYLSNGAAYERGEAIREKPYTEKAGVGEKYYVGNGAPLPEASGSISAAALAALETELSNFDADAAEAVKAAGLTLPAGTAFPKSTQTADQRWPGFKRLVRYEMGDALALELRAPDAENSMFDSLVLMFLRSGENYTFLTAFPRRGYVYEEADAGRAEICEVNGLNYLYVSDTWTPFLKGGATTKFRTSGGCKLNGVSGAPLSYSLTASPETLEEEKLQTLAIQVRYEMYYEAGVWFEIPLRLYNDGDGKGFYSLDANSAYLFTDILSVPYARDQIESQLRLRSESSNRSTRTVAAALLKKVFGEAD